MINFLGMPISLQDVIDGVRDPAAGAIDVFIGTTRNSNAGREVIACEYDAYVPMAKTMLEDIAGSILAESGIHRISIVHRLGRVEAGEISVVIAVAAAHRNEAFVACRRAIDRLKQDVPIWKKEVTAGGAEWIGRPF